MLRFMHRDGELVGLERKLSDSETLKVTRDANGFSTDVLENPLEVRTRTASATIDSSPVQAAADAEPFRPGRLRSRRDLPVRHRLRARHPGGRSIHRRVRRNLPGRRALLRIRQHPRREIRQRRPRVSAPCATSMPTGTGEYYTPDGKSLRKAFMRAPVQFSRISSRFNPSRRHPVLNRIRAHKRRRLRRAGGHAGARRRRRARALRRAARAVTATSIELEHGSGVVTVYGHLFAIRAEAAPRPARGARPGHRLRRQDGPRHRPASALRISHPRRPQESADRAAARCRAHSGRRTRRISWRRRPGLVNMLDLPAGPALVAR